MNINKALLYFNTIKYLRPSQTAGRVYSNIKTRLFRDRTEACEPVYGKLRSRTSFLQHDPWNCREGLLKGMFTFLNTEKHFPLNKIDWNCNDMPLLWRFNLHYFGYLFLLNDDEKLEICKDWIINNPVGKTVGWHPYPLSLRIVNWSKAGIYDSEVSNSIFKQASYLYRHLETYHPGNHLLENARALIFAGVLFQGQNKSGRWIEKGLRILRKELRLQVLEDGGYFERSIMYHALMLELVLDVINILPENEESTRKYLTETAKKMGTFLHSLTHPDRKIALFNDSTFEIAAPVDEILSYLFKLTGITPESNFSFRETGFYIFKDKDLYLSIDGGPVGPDYLPAHAHADIFSYELSLFSKRIIVDSGVYEYPAGEMRSYVRGTRAHNTVVVDDMDQAECWGSFRVARRYPPSDVSYERGNNYFRFQGSFDGYSSLIGDNLRHRRMINYDTAKRTITFEDHVSGKGKHVIKSFIHFNPDIKIQFVDNAIFMNVNNRKIKLIIDSEQYYFGTGWYCPRFGEKITNTVLVVTADRLPAYLTYRISF